MERKTKQTKRANGLIKETIKLIYKGEYGLDNEGRLHKYKLNVKNVKSIDRVINYIGRLGYVEATVMIHGSGRKIKMHRLIWYWYYGELPENKVVNHKDGVKHNNDIRNLEMVTHKENSQHAVRIGAIKSNWENRYSKLTKENYKEIKNMLEQNIKLKTIAKKFKVNPCSIRRIRDKLKEGIEGL